MSEQAKLPGGAVRAVVASFYDDVFPPDANPGEKRIAAEALLREALPTILAQRDNEWRERLLGDEAVDAAYAAFFIRPTSGPFRASTSKERIRDTLRAALDKAAPDGGGE